MTSLHNASTKQVEQRMKVQPFRNLPLLVALAISIPFLLIVIIEPLNSDNAIYHTMALNLVRYGRIPFLGSWAHNFPGMVYIHSISILLLGPSDMALRAFDFCTQLIFVIFFYIFLRRWLHPQTSALACVLYILYYVSAGPSMYVEVDVYGAMVILVAIAILQKTSVERARMLLRSAISGIMVGISILIRPTSLAFVGIFSIYLSLDSNLRFSRKKISRVGYFILGSVLPIGLILLYYSTKPQGLSEFYASTILFNIDLYSSLPTMGSLWWELGRNGFIIFFAAYAIYSLSREKKFQTVPQLERALYFALLISTLGIILLMGKFIRYQFAPFFLFVTPLAAIGIEYFASKFKNPIRKLYAIGAGCFLSTFLTFNPTTPIAFCEALLTGKNSSEFIYDVRHSDDRFGAAKERALLNYLRPYKGTAAICSFEPLLSLHFEKRVGNYVTLTPIALTKNGYRNQIPEYTDYQLKWQNDYMDSLRTAHPRFLIIARGMKFAYIEDIYDDCLHYLPGFDSLLDASYHYDTSFGGYQVFQKNNSMLESQSDLGRFGSGGTSFTLKSSAQ
jgi:hypothetical protein